MKEVNEILEHSWKPLVGMLFYWILDLSLELISNTITEHDLKESIIRIQMLTIGFYCSRLYSTRLKLAAWDHVLIGIISLISLLVNL